MTSKYKTKSEWKKLIHKLSPQDFEDLCFDILKNNKFTNVKPRGNSGDGGRDLEGNFTYQLVKETIVEKCWFQCKRYGEGTALNYKCFSTEVQKAEDQGVKRFFVLSNKDMSSNSKTDVENWNKNHKCQISDVTGTLFLDWLFELPNICKTYFPDEEVPPVVDVCEPKEILPLSKNLGNRFGLEIQIDAKGIDINNPNEIGKVLKEGLLNLKGDINIKAMVYEKCSLFFLGINQPENAIFFLNKSLDITPKNINAMLNKGYILEKMDELEESNEIYDEIFEIDKDNIMALNNKAYNLLRLGDLKDAEVIINKCLKLENKYVLAIKNKIKILKGLDKLDEADIFLEENKDVFEKSIELMLEQVDISIHRIDLKKAYELNEIVLKKEPDNIVALNYKGVIFEWNSKYQKGEKYLGLAYQIFDKLIEKNKDYPLGWSNKTVVLMNSNKLDEAKKIIDLAYSIFPKSPDVMNKLGVYFLTSDEPKKALKYFNSALKRYYKSEYLLNRAKANYKLRQYPKVISDMDRLLKLEPKNSFAWGLKGEAIKKLRRAGKEICFKKAEEFVKNPISLLE